MNNRVEPRVRTELPKPPKSVRVRRLMGVRKPQKVVWVEAVPDYDDWGD